MEFQSEEEKQYYDYLLNVLKDGDIDYDKRKLSNNQKEKYHISDERALELEKLAILNAEELSNIKTNDIKEYSTVKENNHIKEKYIEVMNKGKIKLKNLSFFKKLYYVSKIQNNILLKIWYIISIFLLEAYLLITSSEKLKAEFNLLDIGNIFKIFIMVIAVSIIFVLLYFIYSYVPAIISIFLNRNKSDIYKTHVVISFLLPIVISLLIFIYISSGTIKTWWYNENINKSINKSIKEKDFNRAYQKIKDK